jgi:hypothetical protein
MTREEAEVTRAITKCPVRIRILDELILAKSSLSRFPRGPASESTRRVLSTLRARVHLLEYLLGQ